MRDSGRMLSAFMALQYIVLIFFAKKLVNMCSKVS